MPGVSVEQFIAACRADVGYVETPTNRTKFASMAHHANGYAWCHTFLVGEANATGLNLPDGVDGDAVPDVVAGTAYTPSGANAWKAAGRWSLTPHPGDWGYIDFPGDGVDRISHVALITAVHPDGTVSTIEGNTSSGVSGSQRNGGMVATRRRLLSLFKGFGRPRYGVAAPPPPPPAVVVRAGSIEQGLLYGYPDLFKCPARVVGAQPTDADPYAARNKDDIGFGVVIYLARANYVGANRYETLALALRGENIAR